MDWKNHLEKKHDPKNWKKSKNQSEIAVCEQKTTSEKAKFCSNTVFSLYFKILPKSPLQFDFINHENVWTDLKKT